MLFAHIVAGLVKVLACTTFHFAFALEIRALVLSHNGGYVYNGLNIYLDVK